MGVKSILHRVVGFFVSFTLILPSPAFGLKPEEPAQSTGLEELKQALTSGNIEQVLQKATDSLNNPNLFFQKTSVGVEEKRLEEYLRSPDVTGGDVNRARFLTGSEWTYDAFVRDFYPQRLLPELRGGLSPLLDRLERQSRSTLGKGWSWVDGAGGIGAALQEGRLRYPNCRPVLIDAVNWTPDDFTGTMPLYLLKEVPLRGIQMDDLWARKGLDFRRAELSQASLSVPKESPLRIVTVFAALRYFQDPLGTLVHVYNQLPPGAYLLADLAIPTEHRQAPVLVDFYRTIFRILQEHGIDADLRITDLRFEPAPSVDMGGPVPEYQIGMVLVKGPQNLQLQLRPEPQEFVEPTNRARYRVVWYEGAHVAPFAYLPVGGLEEIGRPNVPPERRAVIFGVGNIGRGYLAPLLTKQDDFDVIFVDLNQPLIDEVNHRGTYTVTPVGAGEPFQVEHVWGIPAKDSDAVTAQGARADWIFTAVGTNNIVKLAPALRQYIQRRLDEGRMETLNIIFAENLPVDQPQIEATRQAVVKDADAAFRQYVDERVNFIGAEVVDEKFRRHLDESVGFVGAVVQITVPELKSGSENPLDIKVEGGAYQLIVDAKELRETPFIPAGIQPVSNIRAYREKKLLIHNMGHAALAYLSAAKGLEDSAQGMQDPQIAKVVRLAMEESAAGLLRRYPEEFSQQQLAHYIEELLGRFANRELGDTVERIGRDPLRKLQPSDRLVGAAANALSAGRSPEAITLCIAAAIRYARINLKIPEDQLAPVIQEANRLGLALPESEDAFWASWSHLTGLEEPPAPSGASPNGEEDAGLERQRQLQRAAEFVLAAERFVATRPRIRQILENTGITLSSLRGLIDAEQVKPSDARLATMQTSLGSAPIPDRERDQVLLLLGNARDALRHVNPPILTGGLEEPGKPEQRVFLSKGMIQFLQNFLPLPKGVFPSYDATTRLMLEAMEWLKPIFAKAKVLDTGAGTGVLGLAAVKEFGADLVLATEPATYPLDIVQQNAFKLGVSDRVKTKAGSLLDPAHDEKTPFDVALFNALNEVLAETYAEQVGAVLAPEGIALLMWHRRHEQTLLDVAHGSGLFIEPILEDEDGWRVYAITRNADRLLFVHELMARSRPGPNPGANGAGAEETVKEQVEKLLPLFTFGTADQQKQAAQAIREIGLPAIPPLLESLNDRPDSKSPHWARPRGAALALTALAPDIPAKEKGPVIKALREILGISVIGPIVKKDPKMEGHPHTWLAWVVPAVVGALRQLGPKAAKETAEELKKAVANKTEPVRIAIREALKNLPSTGLEEVPVSYLAYIEPQVRTGDPGVDTDLLRWIDELKVVSPNAPAVFQELVEGYRRTVPDLSPTSRYHYTLASFEDNVLKALWQAEGQTNRALQVYLARRIFDIGQPLYRSATPLATPYKTQIPPERIPDVVEAGLVRLVQVAGWPWGLTPTSFRLLPAKGVTVRQIQSYLTGGLEEPAAQLRSWLVEEIKKRFSKVYPLSPEETQGSAIILRIGPPADQIEVRLELVDGGLQVQIVRDAQSEAAYTSMVLEDVIAKYIFPDAIKQEGMGGHWDPNPTAAPSSMIHQHTSTYRWVPPEQPAQEPSVGVEEPEVRKAVRQWLKSHLPQLGSIGDDSIDSLIQNPTQLTALLGGVQEKVRSGLRNRLERQLIPDLTRRIRSVREEVQRQAQEAERRRPADRIQWLQQQLIPTLRRFVESGFSDFPSLRQAAVRGSFPDDRQAWETVITQLENAVQQFPPAASPFERARRLVHEVNQRWCIERDLLLFAESRQLTGDDPELLTPSGFVGALGVGRIERREMYEYRGRRVPVYYVRSEIHGAPAAWDTAGMIMIRPDRIESRVAGYWRSAGLPDYPDDVLIQRAQVRPPIHRALVQLYRQLRQTFEEQYRRDQQRHLRDFELDPLLEELRHWADHVEVERLPPERQFIQLDAEFYNRFVQVHLRDGILRQIWNNPGDGTPEEIQTLRLNFSRIFMELSAQMARALRSPEPRAVLINWLDPLVELHRRNVIYAYVGAFGLRLIAHQMGLPVAALSPENWRQIGDDELASIALEMANRPDDFRRAVREVFGREFQIPPDQMPTQVPEQSTVASTHTGLEETVNRAFVTLAEAAEGKRVFVVQTSILTQRVGLEEFLARMPREVGRVILFGEGSAAAKELAARSDIIVVDSDRIANLAVTLIGLEEANKINYLGDPSTAQALARMLPASMQVAPIDPAAGLEEILRALGFPKYVLEQINAVGLEEQLTYLHAA